ncbi:MAG: guanylate kinase [Nitrospirae bacterium 13_2_20CM_2_63_8]|nr:MAG: guanylate kinase [Nitrospirae bacterium 13_2_20CM_2_63_8]TLY36926.1 MAG: guanylate kinase [Nitrospirota bacterium]
MSSKDAIVKRRQGILFVVSAPSGAGKTSLCQELVSQLPDLRYSVSYTTRKPRPAEIADRHYHFVDEATFRDMIKEGAFLEWAEVYGNLYGTPRAPIKEWISQGIDVLLDIDTQGALQIRRHEPDAVSIYILPPSLEVLRRRLEDRKGDAPDEIARRLKKARDEVKHYRDYIYVIINEDFKFAVRQLEAIVLAERSRTALLDLSAVEQALMEPQEDR